MPRRPLRVVDLGIEHGFSGIQAKKCLHDAVLAGVEAHFETWQKAPAAYDEVYYTDAIKFLEYDSGPTDLAICAELIEHYSKDDGLKLLGLLEALPRAILTTPTGFMPQGAIEGNEFQIHRSGWEPDEFTDRGWVAELVSPAHRLGVYTWGF